MSDWPLAKISQLTTKVGSGGETAYKPTGIPLIRSMNVHFGGFKRDGLAYLDDQQAKGLDNAIVKADDVLLNITGASIGRVTWAPADLDGARVNQHVCIIRPREGLEPKFLAHFLASPPQQRRIMYEQVGATRQGLTKGRILEFDVPVPPLPEQRRIVAKIEELFSDLDAGVAALERVRTNLNRYRAAVLKAAVEGRLTEEWRTRHPAIEPAVKLLELILAERRAKWEQDQLRKFKEAGKPPPKGWKEKYEPPAPPASVGDVSLPASWTMASLEQLTSAVRVICYGILMPKDHVPTGVPYVKVRDMRGDVLNVSALTRTLPEIAAQFARASLRPGDLLLAIRGTYGRAVEVPAELDGGNITQDTARLAVSDLADRQYVLRHIRSMDSQNYFKRVARGVAVKGVNIGDVRPAPILLPPVAEQSEIVAEVDRRLSVTDAAEKLVEHALQRASRLRQAILKRAFEGKLVPQDPTDEPAAALLERIKPASNGKHPTPDKPATRRSRARV